MEERYFGANLVCRAEFSAYRQFRVDTSMEIGKPPN
jgi:hypothetical protein